MRRRTVAAVAAAVAMVVLVAVALMSGIHGGAPPTGWRHPVRPGAPRR
ncbi:hypothetical protein ACFO0M_17110 [Micromonospora mangrovi]|uniref:Uncharacterized protein n=2 Tax=Micromonospora TaxID=1873 RepID=A0AAU7MBJ6_9ACTN